MKKIVVLVIASVQQEVYKWYICNYWSKMIKHCNEHRPNVDIFLLFDYGVDISKYEDIRNNIIVDLNDDYNGYIEKGTRCNGFIPGILSKTVYAFGEIQNKYDVIFRTNLSSMIVMDNLIKYVEEVDIIYSGFYIWTNALRSSLIYYNKIGENKSIKNVDELEEYPGNTFISGSGYFLNNFEIIEILKNKSKIRYDIVDDVSIGLMLANYESINRKRHLCIKSNTDTKTIASNVLQKCEKELFHIRLQHFHLDKAVEIFKLFRENKIIDKCL